LFTYLCAQAKAKIFVHLLDFVFRGHQNIILYSCMFKCYGFWMNRICIFVGLVLKKLKWHCKFGFFDMANVFVSVADELVFM